MCSHHCVLFSRVSIVLFFFNDTATTEIYTLSLHDALPIFTLILIELILDCCSFPRSLLLEVLGLDGAEIPDRKSTRLNSSHMSISYAVFCLKKKKLLTPSPPIAWSALTVPVKATAWLAVRP